uniref:Uncharacterized protein n=1 Tax=Rhizophora mucronata TaxID=61149 RepID=A0A2P2Q2S9_RHIMU
MLDSVPPHNSSFCKNKSRFVSCKGCSPGSKANRKSPSQCRSSMGIGIPCLWIQI